MRLPWGEQQRQATGGGSGKGSGGNSDDDDGGGGSNECAPPGNKFDFNKLTDNGRTILKRSIEWAADKPASSSGGTSGSGYKVVSEWLCR